MLIKNASLLLLWLVIIGSNSCLVDAKPLVTAEQEDIIVGAYRSDIYLPRLKNKRVGLVVNQTSIVGSQHLVDYLLENGVDKCYPSLAFFEATPITIGRGTDFPFQVIGHDKVVVDSNVSFTPTSRPLSAKYPKFENISIHGYKLRSDINGGLDLKLFHQMVSCV